MFNKAHIGVMDRCPQTFANTVYILFIYEQLAAGNGPEKYNYIDIKHKHTSKSQQKKKKKKNHV